VANGGSLLTLALLAPVVGAAAGILGATFRLALEQADRARNALVAWAHGESLVGLALVVAVCAAATALAAGLVRRVAPEAAGSGIPNVEAVLAGYLPPAPLRVIPVKFVGGVLAIGAGLALGREGPSVQMGACVGTFIGRCFGRDRADSRVLLAAGAGAGLATAFNAPIGGAVFVLEELVKRFETRVAIAALGASATAISVSWLFLGTAPDFRVEVLLYPDVLVRVLCFALGAAAGLLAIVYNRTLLAVLAAADRLRRWPVELRAGVVGAAVGGLAWFAPTLVGGGDPLTQSALAGVGTLALLPALLVLRLALGAVSYAAGTPGGLFAPLLVLGAQFGLCFGILCQWAFPDQGLQPQAFAVLGMVAFFTGVVRAPLTGIVLVIEMTNTFPMLLPMVGACFTAMLVPTLFGDPPIYESLRQRTLPTQPAGREPAAAT
jgi:CIC family chloride channel protein